MVDSANRTANRAHNRGDNHHQWKRSPPTLMVPVFPHCGVAALLKGANPVGLVTHSVEKEGVEDDERQPENAHADHAGDGPRNEGRAEPFHTSSQDIAATPPNAEQPGDSDEKPGSRFVRIVGKLEHQVVQNEGNRRDDGDRDGEAEVPMSAREGQIVRFHILLFASECFVDADYEAAVGLPQQAIDGRDWSRKSTRTSNAQKRPRAQLKSLPTTTRRTLLILLRPSARARSHTKA
jgi:hypothetical protein